MHWKRIALAGVGLLGGSLGLALKQRRLADTVVGYVRRPASVAECERLRVLDTATCDLAQAVAGADLIVLCTPLAQMRPLTQRMLPALPSGAIITDVGSVKTSVLRELESPVAAAGGHFIGSHPLAGGERSGVAAASPDLFVNAICVLTPTANSHPPALREIEGLWRSVGARVIELAPAAHDALVSRSSHLPHVVAAQLVNLVLSPEHPAEQWALCANGFRDVTRIASGSPEMWRDIALANRENLARALEGFLGGLQDFRDALKRGDEPAITRFFQAAKTQRDGWTAGAAAPAP